MDRTVGIVGVGVMGTAFAHNLMKGGFAVVGFDPVKASMDRLVGMGGRALASPRAVAEAAEIVFLSLPSSAALDGAVNAADGLAAANAATILVECSTLPLADKQKAAQELSAAGKTLLDCPVSGTGAQAMKKDLIILGSGDEAAYQKAVPALMGMSRAQRYLGAFGNGSIMKYIANLLVTIHTVSTAEAFVLGMKAGFDPQVILDTLHDSAGGSRMMQVRGPIMVDQSYDHVTASVKTHTKDLAIIEEFAANLQCPTPLFAAASQMYRTSAALGREMQDTASVCAAMEVMAGFSRKA
jgi:3-hydroxyisobutyrate dehydrogenase